MPNARINGINLSYEEAGQGTPLQAKTSREWAEILNTASVPCGPILNVREVFEEPQVQHLGLATEVTHPKRGALRVQNVPVTLSRTPGAGRPRPRSAPTRTRS